MAVDNLQQRQMACKVVKLSKSPQRRSGKLSLSGSFWREVDLLKDISHVRTEIRLLTRAYLMFSPTFCTSSVCSLPRKSCMTKLSVSRI